MFINGCKSIIIRCRFCGRLKDYNLNLFSLSENKEAKYKCECGDTSIAIEKIHNDSFNMKANCINCGGTHIIRLNLKEILTDMNIPCCFYNMDLCFIGDGKKANQILLENQINAGRNENAIYGDEYFNNFKIFGEALGQLYFLNSEQKINCDCGKSKIRIHLFSDRLELKCNTCQSVKIIFAETEEDLSILMKKDKITLREHNISCIDSISEKNRDIRE